MSTLTEWLDQAQARADAATDGPWAVQRRTPNSDVNVTTEAVDPALAEPRFVASTGDPHYDGTVTDAEFIAAARTDLPAAIAALRAVADREPLAVLLSKARHPVRWEYAATSTPQGEDYAQADALIAAIASALGVQS